MRETACRVKNGWASLGCLMAYAEGDEIRMSKLAAIEVLSRGYGMQSVFMLTLDDGKSVQSDNIVNAESNRG